VARPSRREVWTVDLGIAGKVRPCLLLTDYPQDDELALITVVPHREVKHFGPWFGPIIGRFNLHPHKMEFVI